MSCVQSLGIVMHRARIAANAMRRGHNVEPALSRLEPPGEAALRIANHTHNPSPNPLMNRLRLCPVARPKSLVGYSRKKSTKMRRNAYQKMKFASTTPG